MGVMQQLGTSDKQQCGPHRGDKHVDLTSDKQENGPHGSDKYRENATLGYIF